MRLKRSALSLVDTEQKMTKKFVLGLDPKIHGTMILIDPKMYDEAFITAKTLEKPKDEVRREQPVTVGRKRPYDSGNLDNRPPTSKPHYADRSAL